MGDAPRLYGHMRPVCVLLPFERYWTDDRPGVIFTPEGLVVFPYTVAYSGRCNGVVK